MCQDCQALWASPPKPFPLRLASWLRAQAVPSVDAAVLRPARWTSYSTPRSCRVPQTMERIPRGHLHRASAARVPQQSERTLRRLLFTEAGPAPPPPHPWGQSLFTVKQLVFKFLSRRRRSILGDCEDCLSAAGAPLSKKNVHLCAPRIGSSDLEVQDHAVRRFHEFVLE
jgi:hypothetical protein